MSLGERRVKMSNREQRQLILDVAKKYGSIKKLAIKWGLPYSTLKNYALEVCLLPESLFDKILSELSINKDKLEVDYLDRNWGMKVGGKRAIDILKKRYPDKIKKWRINGLKKAIKIGKHWGYMNQKVIKEPKLNEKLAELIGAYLGDGTITKYQLKISGDYRYDLPYFYHLRKLVFELFGLSCSIIKEKKFNTANLIIYSKNLCSFINKEFGINFGHKIRNKTSIPNKILQDNKLSIACLRGLIDTDGSISRRGRNGSQFCIQFTSHNKYLLEQVKKIGADLNIFTFGDETGCGTNKGDNIKRYFDLVGSSNLRHIVRFNEKFSKGNTIYKKDVLNYYQKGLYSRLDLPFKIKLAQ